MENQPKKKFYKRWWFWVIAVIILLMVLGSKGANTPQKVGEILNHYAKAVGINRGNIASYLEKFKNKKYCLLVFLSHPKQIEPFEIDKSGFGAMAAWLTVDNFDKVKVSATGSNPVGIF